MKRKQPISRRIRQRLERAGQPYAANDLIAAHIGPEEIYRLEEELTGKMQAVLDTLVIDTERDHNTNGTAGRMAKMYLREIFRGRYEPPPAITDFPNVKKLDELYIVGPITVRSTCSHHLCPIEGSAWCGVIPGGGINGGDRIIGISKFSRLADWVLSRPQIQEEAVVQLADEIERRVSPRGLAVVIRARHSCMTWRGVRENATMMTTSVMRGIFREGPAARAEFFAMIDGDFKCQ